MKTTIKIMLSIPIFFSIMQSCNNGEAMKKAFYAGNDITKTTFITRDKDSKAAFLTIQTDGAWSLYGGTSVDSIDFSKTIAEGAGSGIFPLNVPDSVRYYFQLITDEGAAVLSEKHLPMAGGYNFRDMGGIKTSDGHHVKWGKVFRSDDLHKLTNADLRYLASIPLITIVDFRSEEEIQQGADKLPVSVTNHELLSITPGNLRDAAVKLEEIDEHQADSLMMDVNKLLVTNPACIEQYKKYFALLQNEKDVPLMFHCSAGKDRTGMAAALFLFSLGVDEETILNDYLLSNTYLEDKYAENIKVNPALKSLFEVKPSFLKAGLMQIKNDHGTIENYLQKILNVDLEKMKVLYLDNVNSNN